MKCKRCGQFGDWLGDESQWTPLDDQPAVHALYRCVNCGNTQHLQ